jgi:hypothetical protein
MSTYRTCILGTLVRNQLHCMSRQNGDVARFLAEHGADVSGKDKGGSTPQHLVSEWGHAELGRLLVEHGADVSGCQQKTWTGRLRCIGRCPKVMRYLRGSWSSTSARTRAGRSRCIGRPSCHGSCGTCAVPRRESVNVSAKNESGMAPRIRVSPPLLRAGSGYTTGTDILCSHIYPVQPTRASLCVGLWSHVYCSIEIASQCTCCYYLYEFSDPLTRNTLNLVPGIPVPCTGAGI